MADSADKLERWKKPVLILTLINTLLAAVISGLEVDAGIRASGANRDSQFYALQVSIAVFRAGLLGNYDVQTFYELGRNEQESLVQAFTALDPQIQSDTQAVANLELQANVESVRADAAKAFSIFYTDPRYAPATEADLPDIEGYLADSMAESQNLLQLQNAASDEYAHWDKKSDAYIGILTLLAIAFLLLGLAQAIPTQPQAILGSVAAFLMLAGTFWAALTLCT